MTPHDQTFSEFTDLRMPSAAKARIRAELSAYADFHTVRPARGLPLRSPFYRRQVFSVYGLRALSLLLVVGIFGGTAAASTQSLPGDVLYPVKVRVAEPVQTALIPTAAGKATWQASLAERRLEEATQLAVEQRLDPETEQALAESFETHVQESLASAETVEQSGDIVTSLAVRSDLEAKVTAHKTILQTVVDKLATTTTDADAPAEGLLKVVAETREVVTAERVDAEVALATASTSGGELLATAPEAGAPEVATLAATDSSAGAATLIASSDPVSDAQIAQATVAREQEIASILEKHSDLLGSIGASPDEVFAAAATTTATTTLPVATTTPVAPGTTTPIMLPAAGASLDALRTAPALKQNLSPQRLP